MSKKRVFSAIATLAGCTIGAGILGIPYVVAKAGIVTGLINIALVGIIFIVINLCLGEVTLRTKGKHQLTGYAGKYLGKVGKYIMFIAVIIGDFGAIIAYIMGGGTAISSLFGISELFASTIFFAIMATLIFFGLKAIEDSEAIATPILLTMLVFFIVMAFIKFNPNNFSGFNGKSFFVPFGVIIFAMIGTAAIPEMREELSKNKKSMKKAIIIGTLIPLVLYALFAVAIVGVHGLNTNEIGSMNIADIIGENLSFLGALFAIFNMATSFLAIGLALKEIFWYDMGMKKNHAWFIACVFPFIFFLLIKFFDLAGFITMLDISGIVGGVTSAIIILFMTLKAKNNGERKPEYEIKINRLTTYFISALLLVAGITKLISMW
jgi:tyrosine-specific transport protein